MGGMQKAQQFAGADKFGRAKQAWTAGGGEWNPQVHQAMQQMGDIKSGRLQQALRFGQSGMWGRAADQIKRGGGEWGDPGEGVGGMFRDYLGANPEADTGSFNYGDISESDLAQAQRFAGAGMMGRAKGLFGDSWTGGYGDRMRNQLAADAARNPYEKGTSMGFDWGDVGAGRLAKAKEFALAGKMGRAKNVFESGKKAGKWSPQMLQQMKAYQRGNK
jgi:hypothetical protein